jgi:hypothetical protein
MNEYEKQRLKKQIKNETLMKQMQKIGYAEIENAEQTIPLVQKDSRLGWEPSMEYIGDEQHLRWKIRYMRYVLDGELGFYRKMIEKTL